MMLRRQMLLMFVLMALPFATAIGQERVLQTNSGSGNIHLIDPATNKIVGEITGVPVNHGAAGSPDGKRLYKNPVALLSSAATFSAAEDFLVAFRVMSRGIIVGERSGGSTGQPLFFALPGGGSARVCTTAMVCGWQSASTTKR